MRPKPSSNKYRKIIKNSALSPDPYTISSSSREILIQESETQSRIQQMFEQQANRIANLVKNRLRSPEPYSQNTLTQRYLPNPAELPDLGKLSRLSSCKQIQTSPFFPQFVSTAVLPYKQMKTVNDLVQQKRERQLKRQRLLFEKEHELVEKRMKSLSEGKHIRKLYQSNERILKEAQVAKRKELQERIKMEKMKKTVEEMYYKGKRAEDIKQKKQVEEREKKCLKQYFQIKRRKALEMIDYWKELGYDHDEIEVLIQKYQDEYASDIVQKVYSSQKSIQLGHGQSHIKSKLSVKTACKYESLPTQASSSVKSTLSGQRSVPPVSKSSKTNPEFIYFADQTRVKLDGRRKEAILEELNRQWGFTNPITTSEIQEQLETSQL